jgi:subtilisin family serine protease
VQKRIGSVLVAGVVLAGCADATSPERATPLAALVQPAADVQVEVVPNEYIVVLRKGVNDVSGEAAKAQRLGAQVMNRYQYALKGYAVRLSPAALRELRKNPNIDFIQPNQVMHADVAQQCSPYTNCPWGLDRIDEENLPMDGIYNQPPQAPNQGASVHVYSIDTGVRITHNEFGGRASNGFDCISSDPIAQDDNGHGTHTSGTMAGSTYGVAKQAQVVAVKVLNAGGSGSTAQVVCGVDWVTQNAIKPAVANMSLGGGIQPALDNAVAASIASGVSYSLSAGNDFSLSACQKSPARVATAMTVAATGNPWGQTPPVVPPPSPDARAAYSNIGTCVDIFAPGSNILSSWNSSDNATNNISGTSMAAPHVAGAIALLLDVKPNLTPAQVSNILTNRATTGVVQNPGNGSPNRLLNVNIPHRP